MFNNIFRGRLFCGVFFLVFILGKVATVQAQLQYSLTGVTPGLEDGCDGLRQNIDSDAQQFIDTRQAQNGSSNTFFKDFDKQNGFNINGAYCQPKVSITYTECDYNQYDGTQYNCLTRTTSFTGGWGNIIQVPACPPEGNNTDYTVMLDDEAGTPTCYHPDQLADADTCDEDGTSYPVTGLSQSSVCYNKADGSKCQLNFDAASGNYVSVGGPFCYNDAFPEYTPPETTDNSQCTPVDSGTWCPADEGAVCDANGVCPTGCGNITYQGETVFGCITQDGEQPICDADGDGITDSNCLIPDGEFDDSGIVSALNSVNSNIDTTNGLLAEANQIGNGIKSSIDSQTTALGAKLDAVNQNLQGVEEAAASVSGVLTRDFSTDAGGRDTSNWSGLFDQSSLDAVLQSVADKKAEIQTELSIIQSEFDGLVAIGPVTNTFDERNITVKGVDYDVSFSRFSDIYSWIGLVVMLCATVASMMIVLGSKS